jgi:hypothetical protein
MVACSSFLDALIINPCDSKISVRLFAGPTPPTADQRWSASVTVEAIASERVEDVFGEAGEKDFIAEVTVSGRGRTIVSVPRTSDDPVPVPIPATLCAT